MPNNPHRPAPPGALPDPATLTVSQMFGCFSQFMQKEQFKSNKTDGKYKSTALPQLQQKPE